MHFRQIGLFDHPAVHLDVNIRMKIRAPNIINLPVTNQRSLAGMALS
jgi:hypothetical protein